VFQSYVLKAQRSVRKNLSFGLQMAGTPKAQIEERVTDAAQTLQQTHPLDRKSRALSDELRQRVAIGRALVGRTCCCWTSRCRPRRPTCAPNSRPI